MSLFSQLFHSKPTEIPQPRVAARLNALEEKLSGLERELRGISREVQDVWEKTRRRLDRYKAWSQPRKDGKFGAEDAAQSTNGPTSNPYYTHSQIDAEARKKGLIQ